LNRRQCAPANRNASAWPQPVARLTATASFANAAVAEREGVEDLRDRL